MPVIHVVAALVVDPAGRMCLVRKRGTDAFMQPGGKPEPGETLLDALRRELVEELALRADPGAFEPLGRFEEPAANEPGHVVVADVWRVVTTERPAAHAEIAEVRWATADEADALGARLAPLARRLLPLADADAPVRAAYDAVAGAYAAAVPDARSESPEDLAAVDAFLAHLPGLRVIDAGCGAGRMIHHLRSRDPALDVAGFDLSPAMAALARTAHPASTIVVGDVAAPPFPPESADGVLAWYSLIHLPPERLPAAVAALARLLVPGGALLAGFQAGSGERRIDRPYGVDAELVAHLHEPRDVAAACAAAGLEPRLLQRRPPRATERHAQGAVLAVRPLIGSLPAAEGALTPPG